MLKRNDGLPTLQTAKVSLNTGGGAPSLKKGPTISLDSVGQDAEPVPQSFEELEAMDRDLAATVYELLTVPEEESEIKKKARGEIDRWRNQVDTGFFFCVAFQSREAREEFLQLSGFGAPGTMYISGEDVARLMGYSLTTRVPAMPNWRSDKRLVNMASRAIDMDTEED